jgi:hypothetical protein
MKTLILVTGQHRSGTSAAAGCLQKLGVELGSHLMPANAANPKGYFEDTRVVGIHDDLLKALGASWDRPEDVPEGWGVHPATGVALYALTAIVQEFAAASDLFAIKDPRAVLFLPLWVVACERAGVRLVLLIPKRLNESCGQSLMRREGWGPERAWDVVKGYQDALDRIPPSIPLTFIIFPDGLWQASNWERIAKELDVDLHVQGGIGQVHAFLDFGLVHHG